ncbi:MAG: hypothetical protein LBV74_12090 [Tannerella sp.]|jgi:hypothetical protein|nr:hypothetical protein [Tannerella sp.]
MKDLHISAKRQKSELKWFAACFCIAVLINVSSIIIYKTPWSEVFTQLLWVLVIACILYALSIAFRLVIYMLKRLF